jgi:hypothetical protein
MGKVKGKGATIFELEKKGPLAFAQHSTAQN